ncbi:MAG TPA: hypothetical protein VF254_07980 [Gammaproteobacteria bacterium]
MTRPWTILLAALPFAATAADAKYQENTSGDVVVLEEVPPADAGAPAPARDIDMPTRGMDMDKVRRVYGEPLNRHAAVGDPPITRWDYENYSVFFEYDKVIHSVVTG